MKSDGLVTTKMDKRQLRAWEMISSKCDIRRLDSDSYLVRSQTKGNFYHVRNADGSGWTCECPDYANRKVDCKHIYAVKFSSNSC